MKRITFFILAFLYISTNTGVTINMHYCMGELVNWEFSHKKDQNCANCGMKGSESDGCCNDQQKLLKLDTVQKIADAAFELPHLISFPALVQPSIELGFSLVPTLIDEHPANNVQPRSSGIAVYLRNRTFLI